MTLNLPLLYVLWWEEYCQPSPNKNQSPNLWHVTRILVCCIFGYGRSNKLVDGKFEESLDELNYYILSVLECVKCQLALRSARGLMPRPCTGQKIFWTGIFCAKYTKNLFTYWAGPKNGGSVQWLPICIDKKLILVHKWPFRLTTSIFLVKWAIENRIFNKKVMKFFPISGKAVSSEEINFHPFLSS